MITTQLNHQTDSYECFEHPKGISLTVPNQALTIREILRRSGVIDAGLPFYFDDDPSHERLDPTLSSDFDLSDATKISNEILASQSRRQAEAEAIAKEAAERNEEKRKADLAESKAKAKAADATNE